MKQFYFLMAGLIGMVTLSNAQVEIDVDPSSGNWVGFMTVFELDQTTFAFQDNWGVPDLQTIIDTKAGTITLQPNFNTYGDNPDDPFWVNQDTGEGNKYMVATTLTPDNTLLGQELTFTGFCESNDLDGAYEVDAFILVANADFSVQKRETAELVPGQNFSISFTNVEESDANVQFGFQVRGANANPADEGTLGSVVVKATALSVEDVNAVEVSTFPNPAINSWNLRANETIQTVSIFNILGQQVMQINPERTQATIDISSLQSGQYIARVTTTAGAQTVKLVKR